MAARSATCRSQAGQWQMLRSPGVRSTHSLMILTSRPRSLDPEAELEVFERFKELRRPVTSHRLSHLLPRYRIIGAERRPGRGARDRRGTRSFDARTPTSTALPSQRRDLAGPRERRRKSRYRSSVGEERLVSSNRGRRSRHDARRVTGLERSGDVALGRLVSPGPDLNCCQLETVQREPLTRASVEPVCAVGGKCLRARSPAATPSRTWLPSQARRIRLRRAVAADDDEGTRVEPHPMMYRDALPHLPVERGPDLPAKTAELLEDGAPDGHRQN